VKTPKSIRCLGRALLSEAQFLSEFYHIRRKAHLAVQCFRRAVARHYPDHDTANASRHSEALCFHHQGRRNSGAAVLVSHKEL